MEIGLELDTSSYSSSYVADSTILASMKINFGMNTRLRLVFLVFWAWLFEKNNDFPFLGGLLALLGFLELLSFLGWLEKLARALVLDLL